MPDSDVTLQDAIYAKAGLTELEIGKHLELTIRSAAGGKVWVTGTDDRGTHNVFAQFESDTLPGDIDIFLVPTVTGQFYRRITVNRQFVQSYIDLGMSQIRFIAAVAERYAETAMLHGFVYCEGDSCTALTHEDDEKCRVCGAPLSTGEEDEDEDEDESAEELPETDVATNGTSPLAASTPPSPPIAPAVELTAPPGVTL